MFCYGQPIINGDNKAATAFSSHSVVIIDRAPYHVGIIRRFIPPGKGTV